jgi:hypothetical protein
MPKKLVVSSHAWFLGDGVGSAMQRQKVCRTSFCYSWDIISHTTPPQCCAVDMDWLPEQLVFQEAKALEASEHIEIRCHRKRLS